LCAQSSASPSMFSLSRPSRIISPRFLARAPPRRVGGLVDDVWRRSLRPARIGRLAGGKPRLARLPALPGAGGEAENFHLDAAALQASAPGYRRRSARHRDRGGRAIEPELSRKKQRHHGVAEGRLLLVHERQRMIGIGDHARQPVPGRECLPRGRIPRRGFCCAIRRRCSRFASRATMPCRCASCLSR